MCRYVKNGKEGILKIILHCKERTNKLGVEKAEASVLFMGPTT